MKKFNVCDMPSLSVDCSDDSEKISELEIRVSELERIVGALKFLEETKWKAQGRHVSVNSRHVESYNNRVLVKEDKKCK